MHPDSDHDHAPAQVLAWILDHLTDPDKKKQLEEVIKVAKICYIPYDWGHNGKD